LLPNELLFFLFRSPNPILSIDVGERIYAADVDYPMAVVGTANRGLIIYTLVPISFIFI
jgi:mRNA export factor